MIAQQGTEHLPTLRAATSLADVVSANALYSGTSGVVLLATAPWAAEWFAVPPLVTLGLGLGLLAYAVVLLAGLAADGRLAATTRIAVTADVAWVVAAIPLVFGFPAVLSPAGRAVLAAVTAGVLVLACAQAFGLARLGGVAVTGTAPITLRAQRYLPVPPRAVWSAVADAGDYARFAAGIASARVDGPAGHGMVRVCTDDRGGQWSETCTLWEEGHRYRMSVDTSTYPVYYRVLIAELALTWVVEPHDSGTTLVLLFEGRMKLGLLGRAAARILGRPGRLNEILRAYERELVDPAGRSDLAANA